MKRPRMVLAAGALAVMLAVPSAVLAASPSPLSDCSTSGRLTHHFTVSQLQHALATMPAETREYSNCYDVINKALLSAVGGAHAGGGGSSSGGALLPTPVIVVVVVLIVAAVSLGAVALRRRR